MNTWAIFIKRDFEKVEEIPSWSVPSTVRPGTKYFDLPQEHNVVSMETSSTRSNIMRAVKQAHTEPELVVRKLLHALGLRFRVNRRDLPGSPDIILPKHHKVIFVHGCFWHRHQGCRYATIPKTRQEYWLPKFAANVERDARKEVQLIELGWKVLVVWECETRNKVELQRRLKNEFRLS